MQSILSKLKAHDKLIFFLLKLAFVFFSWKLFSWFIGTQYTPFKDRLWPWLGYQWENLNQFVRVIDIAGGTFFLELFGYNILNWFDLFYSVNGGDTIRVGNYCLGFQLWYYFAMLSIIAPIQSKMKVFGVLGGFVIIRALNILRLFALGLVSVYFPEYAHIGHDYVFNLLVFGFLMWVYVYLNNNYSSTYKTE